jgi:hypothetical protein
MTGNIYIERDDGQVARIEIQGEVEDLFYAIDLQYPKAWNLITEEMVLPDDGASYSFDETFKAGEDTDLATWIAEGMDNWTVELESGAEISADRDSDTATVRWLVDGVFLKQTIELKEGDMVRIILGADPEAEEWDDGWGNTVDKGNARGPFAMVETWRNGFDDGRPETVTYFSTAKEAVDAAKLAWDYLTREEQKKYRCVACIPADIPDEVQGGEVLWESQEGIFGHIFHLNPSEFDDDGLYAAMFGQEVLSNWSDEDLKEDKDGFIDWAMTAYRDLDGSSPDQYAEIDEDDLRELLSDRYDQAVAEYFAERETEEDERYGDHRDLQRVRCRRDRLDHGGPRIRSRPPDLRHSRTEGKAIQTLSDDRGGHQAVHRRGAESARGVERGEIRAVHRQGPRSGSVIDADHPGPRDPPSGNPDRRRG